MAGDAGATAEAGAEAMISNAVTMLMKSSRRPVFQQKAPGSTQYPRQPPRQLDRPVDPACRIRPAARDHELAVRPQLGRALQPLDVGDQAFEVGEGIVVE